MRCAVEVPDGWRIEHRRLDDPDSLRLVGAVQEEYVRLYGGPDSAPMHPEHFIAPRGGFLVGYLGDQPVASAGWRLIDPVQGLPEGARAGELKRMFVLPGRRGLGLSRLMLSAAEADARASGITDLVLETGPRQPAAIGLYRSSGYADADGTGWARYHGQPGVVILGRRLAAEPGLNLR